MFIGSFSFFRVYIYLLLSFSTKIVKLWLIFDLPWCFVPVWLLIIILVHSHPQTNKYITVIKAFSSPLGFS